MNFISTVSLGHDKQSWTLFIPCNNILHGQSLWWWTWISKLWWLKEVQIQTAKNTAPTFLVYFAPLCPIDWNEVPTESCFQWDPHKTSAFRKTKVLTKMCWEMGVFKASHHSAHFWLSLSQHTRAGAFALCCFWRILIHVGMWGEALLPWRHHRATAEGFMGRSVVMWRSQTSLPRVMCCLSFSLCYIQSSPHVNKCVIRMSFPWPVIFTQSIFAFKFNIFRKLCSFWHCAQVPLVPWRKLTMKSHSTSSDCTGIILCL